MLGLTWMQEDQTHFWRNVLRMDSRYPLIAPQKLNVKTELNRLIHFKQLGVAKDT